MKRKHINEIYITRALAILGVLIVHATSFPVSELNTASTMYGVYNFFNTFFRFGTPTFIFLSSFVLFYSYFHRPLNKALITSFYKKRLLYIILPYVIFSVIYYLYHYGYYSTIMTNKEMLVDFLIKLSKGEVYSHLYFIFISIQFYILFPLFLIFFKRFPSLIKHAIWIGFVLQWMFVLTNSYYLQLSNKGSISLSYFSYYFLGIYFGVYYDKIVAFLNVNLKQLFTTKIGRLTILLGISWLGTSCVHVYLWYWSRTTGNWAHGLVYELLWNAHTFLSALFLLQISYLIYRYFSAKTVNVLIHLGAVSFGVYLIHLLILNIYQAQIPPFGSPLLYHSKMTGGFFVSLILSWAIVSLVSKYFSYSWVFFGSIPKSIPYKAVQSENSPPIKDQQPISK